MQIPAKGTLLRVLVDESDRLGNRPLYEAIVDGRRARRVHHLLVVWIGKLLPFGRRARGWAALLLLAAGCSQPFTVTTSIDEAPAGPATVAVQPITDALPADAPTEARPRPEDLAGFERYLIQELQYRPWLELSSAAGETPDYDIRGSVVQYDRGSGFLRFLGIGGATKVTTHLELVQRANGRVVFAGDFQGNVAGWPHLGDHLFSEVAALFAEQLDRRVAKLRGTEPERRRERMRFDP